MSINPDELLALDISIRNKSIDLLNDYICVNKVRTSTNMFHR